MMKLIGVVGVGSPFGADNIALHVIELLKHKFQGVGSLLSSPLRSEESKEPEASVGALRNKIHFEYFDRPGMDLLEYIKDFKIVHLIDAVISGEPAGTIHRFEDITSFQESNQLLSSHGFGVVEALLLGETLNCLPEKIVIHGIEMDKESSVRSPSKKMMSAGDRLADQLARELIRISASKY